MTYITRYGTRVHNERAAGLAITYGPDSAEFFVTRNVIVRGATFAEAGDTVQAKASGDHKTWAFIVNLTTGEFVTADWDVLAHTVRPKEVVVA